MRGTRSSIQSGLARLQSLYGCRWAAQATIRHGRRSGRPRACCRRWRRAWRGHLTVRREGRRTVSGGVRRARERRRARRGRTVGDEREDLERLEVVGQLLGRRRAEDGRRDVRVLDGPRQGEAGGRRAEALGQVDELLNFLELGLAPGASRCATGLSQRRSDEEG